MELFVINRHGDTENEITQEEEQAKLDKILKKIEKRKQSRIKQRERQKKQQEFKPKTTEEKIETPIIKPKENEIDEFIDNTIVDNNEPEITKVSENFTILGKDDLLKKTKVKRVLPKWLTNPTIISSSLQNLNVKVSKIKELDKSLRKKLKMNGIEYFFPVQAEVIPWLLKVQNHVDVMFPRDVCVSAPTGSGKTLAFVLPVIQALKRHTVRKIRALVILPTQDLAAQVFKTFKIYTQGSNIEVGLITGKCLFNNEQKQLLYYNESFGYVSKIDILVCTAGRLVSHLKSTEGFNLQSLEFLVIDEADRVLDNVQDDWLYHLEKHICSDDLTVQARRVLNLHSLEKQKSPQKLLFSATLSQDPEKLEKLSLFQPKLFTSVVEDSIQAENDEGTFAGKYTTPRELMEKYIVCSKDLKPLVLYKFIKEENLTKTIVFTHSVETAHRLKILLQSLFKFKLKIEEISSNLKGTSRDELITNFSKGSIDILICTDSLARGIDLPGVKCVVSYSAPKYIKTYIHRAGRTARAGEIGLTVTFLHKEQMSSFKSLLRQLKKEDMMEHSINEDDLVSLGKVYKKALNHLKETVTKEETTGIKKLISKKKSVKIEKKS